MLELLLIKPSPMSKTFSKERLGTPTPPSTLFQDRHPIDPTVLKKSGYDAFPPPGLCTHSGVFKCSI